MSTSSSAAWTARGTAFLLWALAAASAAFWALRLGGGGPVTSLPAEPPRPVASVDPAALARLLGGVPSASAPAAAAPSLASRFRLLGVVAGVRSGEGAAVIAVDGKPPRPYRVGATIDEGVVLQSVRGRQAVLGAPGAGGQALVTLELPARK
ncbi:MAG: general secretion pathway protein C [Burkholderiales bacterium]|nr:general secretion pathway protein C [Burkholderiales bacterium]